MWKRGLFKQTCEGKTKQTENYCFLDNDTMYARTGLRAHEFNLRVQARSCVHRSLPKNPNQHRNRAKAKT